MTGLALVAEPFIELLLTEKWLPCVPFLQISCFTYAFWPIHTANLQAIKAMGRSDIFLKLEIAKKIIGIIVLVLAIRHGVLVIAATGILTTIIMMFINAYPNRKLIGYTYFEQIKDLLNSFVPLMGMLITVLIVGTLELNAFYMLILKTLTGAISYILLSAMVKNESFNYIFSVVKDFKKK